MMQKALYPNNLKLLVKEAGLNIRGLSRDTGIPEGTLRDWARGARVIPQKDRATLAQAIGCDVHDLAPNHKSDVQWVHLSSVADTEQNGRVVVGKMYGKELETMHASYNIDALASHNALHLMELANVDCFAVDDLITFTQSNSFAGWNRDDIFITRHSAPLAVPQDVETLRQEKLPAIQKDFVNSSHYRLAAYTPAFSDRRGLEVSLAPIGFHDFYALLPYLDDPLLTSSDGSKISVRDKYGHLAFTYSTSGPTCPIPAPVSLQCLIVTRDEQIILMQRSNTVAFYPNHWSASFEETMDSAGLSPRGTIRSGDADFFACALRGMEEEFGVPVDAVESIKILSLNIEYLILTVGVVAIIKTRLTAQ